MKDKKSFGLFIAEKRKEKNLTQAELAQMLFVTKTAVSKWERGVTYPDITLISDICSVLDVGEHELITEGNNGEYRKIQADAKKYRCVSNTYFYGFCGAYAVALLVCFICNLAVNKTLSWFFIVLTSVLTAFTLFPSATRFVNKYRLLTVVASFASALTLLLLTCCIYTGGSWFFIAFVSVIFGLVCVFLPVFIGIYNVPRAVKRHAPAICAATDLFLLFIVLTACLYSSPQDLGKAVLISLYGFVPVAVCVVIISYVKINAYYKSAASIAVLGVFSFFANRVANGLFNGEYATSIDFWDWSAKNINGNVQAIILFAFLFAATVLAFIGIYKTVKTKRENKE